MEDKIKIPELDIEVEDVSDFNDEASEILDAYMESLWKEEGYTRAVMEGDYHMFESEYDTPDFIWTDKGCRAHEAKLDELYAIGRKYFGDTDDLDIISSWFVEL